MVIVRRLAVFAALAVAVAACELASTTIPRTDPQLVIHSILNPSLRVQTVLVEQSLSGSTQVVDSGPYDPNFPVVSGGGVPVTGAVVKLTDPDGLVMTGVEIKTGGVPTGVYEIRLNDYVVAGKPTVIQPGREYSLAVSATGKTVTGSTLVPKAVPPIGVPVVVFNRDHQEVNLPIKDVSLSRAFWVRIEAPVSSYSIFTLDQTVSISGSVRNIFTQDFIRVFYPGFLQTLTVAAVDTNVYDYYRSGSDPFSGRGLLTHLEGGLGLFGSIVTVEKRVLDITQDSTGDPIEGHYTIRSGAASDMPHDITLYLAAKGSKGAADEISGAWVAGPAIAPIRGAIFGQRDGNNLTMQQLEPGSTSQERRSFDGTIKPDTIIAVSRDGSNVPLVFVRAGK